ncbi:MAG TPA: hypothetical protein VHL09_06905 [Dehalococcoidia bacterium]|nr:hypothetical protein [Dehalococcoidia bacterium]
MKLGAERIRVADYFEWLEEAHRRNWTDGLPVVPPTPERVEAMIAASGRDPDEEIGEVPPRYAVATIEALAINSVMGGCLPEYFPVVIAAVECMLEPEFNLNGVQTTTHNNEPLVIVSGPAVERLGLNAGHGVFGNGNRANGTIGRAIKLILWNLGGSYPGEPDKSTFAHPGKWSYCIGENNAANPWEPFHHERGLSGAESAVTVFGCEAPHSLLCHGTADQMLAQIVDATAHTGSNNFTYMGQWLLVIGPEAAGVLSRAGLTKDEIRRHIWEQARLPIARLKRCGVFVPEQAGQMWPDWIDVTRDDSLVPMTPRLEDILIMVAGGEGKFSMQCPGWGGFGGFAVTKPLTLRS